MTYRPCEAIVIGASAGAIDALSNLLPSLTGQTCLPTMIVVHLPSEKNSFIAEVFQVKCSAKVKEAEDKEPIEAGMIYFAPPNYHLLVETDKSLSLSNEEPVLYCRPSIDILFETAAEAYGEKLAGIILTGANSDGAAGLKAVADAGGIAIVIDPALAHVPIMPQAALDACPEAYCLTMTEIANFLQKGELP